jgi:hypothetical protein
MRWGRVGVGVGGLGLGLEFRVRVRVDLEYALAPKEVNDDGDVSRINI